MLGLKGCWLAEVLRIRGERGLASHALLARAALIPGRKRFLSPQPPAACPWRGHGSLRALSSSWETAVPRIHLPVGTKCVA